jgi:formylglycine-generating enzyme required for sulfatase activity
MGTTREEGLKAVDECVTRDGGACQESYIQDATPTHQVTLDDFQIEAYEVSATQYVAFLNQLLAQFPGLRVDLVGCNGQPCVRVQADEPNSIVRFNGTQYELVNPTFYANHPIFFVTWWGADAYCTSLGRRLPTEAEWERAARGPANSIYPWGAEWIPANANTSRSNLQPGTVPVDSFPSGLSAYGVYNMAGNVAEWVWDFYQENYYSLPEAVGPNPRGPAVSDRKVLRGGGWDNVPLFSRTVHRMYADPKSGRASLGFRCAAEAP